MKPRVLITRVLPEPALEVIRQACEVQLDPLDRQLTPAALRQAVVDKHGVLCLITDRIDVPVLNAAAELKVVSNIAVGYDNIDADGGWRCVWHHAWYLRHGSYRASRGTPCQRF